MKTLIKFANAYGLKVARLIYRAHGTKVFGFALVKPADLRGCVPAIKAPYKGYEYITFEPVFTGRERWYVKQAGKPSFYADSIPKAMKHIDCRFDTDGYGCNIFSSFEPFCN